VWCGAGVAGRQLFPIRVGVVRSVDGLNSYSDDDAGFAHLQHEMIQSRKTIQRCSATICNCMLAVRCPIRNPNPPILVLLFSGLFRPPPTATQFADAAKDTTPPLLRGTCHTQHIGLRPRARTGLFIFVLASPHLLCVKGWGGGII